MYCLLVVGVVEVLDLLYCVLGFDVLSILVTCVLCVGYCCNMCIDVSTLDA